jgi:hypothetical protein
LDFKSASSADNRISSIRSWRLRKSRVIVKALGAQEIVVRGMADSPLKADELVQVGMGVAGAEIEILAAAFRIKAQFHRQGLEQRGFSRTIFANKKGHAWMKFQSFEMADGRNANRICIEALDGITIKSNRV